MHLLKNKKILIGVTASIAAYKIILLVRLLVKTGAEVKVVMTPASKEFVSPLVLATLSKNDVLIDLSNNNNWANHVALGRWADVFVIAPLSCNTLAKMATGLCDNLLLAVYLSATCPVVVAPAMDEDMWQHPTTKQNLQKLESFGNKIIEVNFGELGSGLIGKGRMAEPEEIVTYITTNFFRGKSFAGKNILVTAGPTYEAIDPVRFIGNHSSGKMGYAIAQSFYEQGANVILISGPSEQQLIYPAIKKINITTANQLLEYVKEHQNTIDVFIMSAAVADFTPLTVAEEKIKKTHQNLTIELTKTADILKYLGQTKSTNQILIGFALETNHGIENAQKKLTSKNADCIILNQLTSNNQVFGADINTITILHKNGNQTNFETNTKQNLANKIVHYIHQHFFSN
jgi:phosphopantothenoylcysteine decarboxylase/phosphopantothenate--cysteine ligase